MPVAALITWLITASGGLYLLAIWLIEYDREFQAAAATRLPIPVIGAHVLLAVTGLAVWALYLLTDARRLAITAALILAGVALLGLTMGVRWIGVYRAHPASATTAAANGPGATPSRLVDRPDDNGLVSVARGTNPPDRRGRISTVGKGLSHRPANDGASCCRHSARMPFPAELGLAPDGRRGISGQPSFHRQEEVHYVPRSFSMARRSDLSGLARDERLRASSGRDFHAWSR